MSPLDLVFLYLVAGAACAIAIYRMSAEHGSKRWTSAALAVPLWPLWGPVALTARKGRRPRPVSSVAPVATRIRAALDEGIAACEGTPLAKLLPAAASERVLREVNRIESRASELSALLSRPDLDPARAAARLAELEGAHADHRVLATARLHLDNVRRLEALLDRDRSGLEELAGLVEALRTQLVLARYAGTSAEGVGDIVSEVWSRLEGLGEAMETLDPRPVESSSPSGSSPAPRVVFPPSVGEA